MNKTRLNFTAQKIDFSKTDLCDGFWKKRQTVISEKSVGSIYDRFLQTGRFEALKCEWKSGQPNEPHIFWDSDAAKWIESVACIITKYPNPDLENKADELIETIAHHQQEDGYYNCCYLSKHPQKRWTDRTEHELYCAGHLIEAAIAYYKATGKRQLLDVVEKYVDYIYNVFINEKTATFITPGHEEIELALIKLYDLTSTEKYLDLCKFFIDNRGCTDEQEYRGVSHKYSQSHLPVREQKTAEGHCVRACYLYCAMADLTKKTGDEKLLDACKSLFDDIISRKMYITGGIGSNERGEAFTVAYDLPMLTAYSESCAALALAWFAHRMLLVDCDSKYADTIERIMYNNALSSISLDGKAFFYVNPLEIRTELINRHTSQSDTRDRLPITQRKEVFDCSCCPPNITRFIASIADFLYTYDGDTLFVHQYMSSQTLLDGMKISQSTKYPNDGAIRIDVSGVKQIAVRIPEWCNEFNLELNAKKAEYIIEKGYAYINLSQKENVISLNFEMRPFLVYPSSRIRDCIGKAAVQKGPIVYCAEGVDNDFDIMTFALNAEPCLTDEYDEELDAHTITADGTIPIAADTLYSVSYEKRVETKIRLIPYFAFANRGETDMEVYLMNNK